MAMDQASSSDRGAAGRGREASTPAEIPAPGWMDVLGRVYKNITEHRILAIAAGVTFYALLAIFPAIAAFVALYGLVADPATIAGHINALSGVLPAEGLSIVSDQIQRVSAQGSARLGAASIIGLLVSLWSANAGMKAIFDALNVVYQEREKRGFFRLNTVTLAFTLGGMAMIAMSLGLMVAVPPALQALRLPPGVETAIALLRWPLLLVLVALAISLVYRFGPSRDEPKWRWVSWGGAFAAIAWLAASLLFSWYAANIGKFNETYGSLGAAIGFMLWMWVSSIVLLIGAELNAEMEHQTAKDTTEGPPRPLGERGAVMADTVGRQSS
jgi:membrane protein